MTDGVSARAGAPWNSELASVIQLGGSVEWDLGRVQPIQRAWLQADNDDSYALLGSLDRVRWSAVWEAAPVPSHGLQIRETSNIDAQARYLRLEPRGGDGYYSVSELVVHSSRLQAWPPGVAERDGRSVETPTQPPLAIPVLLAAALAGAALFVAARTRRLRRGSAAMEGVPALAWITLAVCVSFAATALDYALGHRFNVVDDAYTSFQYAKNWISGQGLVFNPGERVEGYTNFLWVLLLAPLWPLSGNDPALMTRAATWLCLALAIAGIGLTALIGHKVFKEKALPAAFAVLLLAFDDSYLSYTVVFALENHLLVVLMLAGAALTVYRPRRWEALLGASFALVTMTRPDALLWVGSFFVMHALPLVIRRNQAERAPELSSLLACAAVFAAILAPYLVFRFLYFPDPLPNTFYLKVGSTLDGLSRGGAYVRSFLVDRYGVPLLGVAAIFFTRALWARWLLLHAFLHGAYVVYVGGDFYAGHRFLVALIPSLALLSGVTASAFFQFAQRSPKRLLGIAAAASACVAVRWGTLQHGPYTTDIHAFGLTVDNNVKYMQWLKSVARARSSMVVGDIGATGFFADVSVVDVFGIVDRAIAHKQVPSFGTGKAGHEKVATREEQLARRPTYIKWGYVGDDQPPPGYYVFNDFPAHLRVEGLWVKDDLERGERLLEGRFSMLPAELSSWTRAGTAFEYPPATVAPAGQGIARGHSGYFVNTFHPTLGDGATGRLTSPPFVLRGDRLRLLVGGGRDPERLRVSLLVDGERIFSETGANWETLGRREWRIGALRGKTAALEIVDDAVGAWGHLLVDEVEQWLGEGNVTGYL